MVNSTQNGTTCFTPQVVKCRNQSIDIHTWIVKKRGFGPVDLVMNTASCIHKVCNGTCKLSAVPQTSVHDAIIKHQDITLRQTRGHRFRFLKQQSIFFHDVRSRVELRGSVICCHIHQGHKYVVLPTVRTILVEGLCSRAWQRDHAPSHIDEQMLAIAALTTAHQLLQSRPCPTASFSLHGLPCQCICFWQLGTPSEAFASCRRQSDIKAPMVHAFANLLE
mmetsp:Transcript_83868/g.166437  ORF Transcript_83868/g.166437 Transcript_83868/m.166437 type:complete len:221 (-) Transcript_83868:254-916(-)